MRFTRNQKYRVPTKMIQHLCGWPEKQQLLRAIHFLRAMHLTALPEVRFGGDVDERIPRPPDLAPHAESMVARGPRTGCQWYGLLAGWSVGDAALISIVVPFYPQSLQCIVNFK